MSRLERGSTPCGDCDVTKECCSGNTLALLPSQVAFWLQWQDKLEISTNSVGGAMVRMKPGQTCPAYDEESHGCSIHETDNYPDDCERFPLNADGERSNVFCARQDEFEERPINVIFVRSDGVLSVG